MNERDKKLAIKAGWIAEAGEPDAGCLNLEQFAAIVRADERAACATHYLGIMRGAIAEEREACAKLADKYMERWTADAIRARSGENT